MIFVNKGIEIGTQALTLEIIADTCGGKIAREATFLASDLVIFLDESFTLTMSVTVGTFVRKRKWADVPCVMLSNI